MRSMERTTRVVLYFASVFFFSFASLWGAQPVSGRTGQADSKTTVNYFEMDRVATPPRVTRKESGDKAGEYMPLNRPLPSGAVIGRELLSRSPVSQAQMTLVSPPPAASFAALGDNNTVIPPDVNGAAGPSHLMVTLNSQVRIQNRTGGIISTVSLNSFWSGTGATGVFDPKILYDPYQNHWMFTAVSNSRSSASSVLIGVSQTSDPTGAWNLYRIDADPANAGWADYPSFGFNKNWIVVQVNMFGVVGDAFLGSNVYAFNKANLYAGGAGLFTLFLDGTGGFAQTPAITHDSALSTMYLLEDWNGNSSGMGVLRLSTITGAVGSETYTPGVVFPSVADPWEDIGSTGFTDFAPQLGSAQKIMCNDARMQNTVYRNGSLWSAHTIFLPAGSGTRCSAQWWKLSTAGAILDRGRIDDPSGNIFYAFPSIAVNKNNDALLGFSRFSAAQFASGNYAFRAASDPAATFRIDTVLKAGEASYFKTFGGGRNRWGDYSGTVMDPVNDVDFWTIQEYAATPSGSSRWGTWWGKVVPPPSDCAADTTDPGVTCPANIVRGNDPDQCNAVVNFSASATDNCPGVLLACTPPSGSTFSIGTAGVTCIASDSAGNADTCSFTVTVNDTQKPSVNCPANIVAGNEPGACSKSVSYSASASDNCPGVTLVCTPPSGSVFPVGGTNVKCVATDAAGNKDSCTFTVTVNDTQKPTVSCPADFAISAAPGQCEAPVTYTATASDNCPGVALVCTPPSGILFHVGVTTVNCVATDNSGNKDSCQFSVTVNDTEKPVLNCPLDFTVDNNPGQCGSAVNYSASASDNCGPPFTLAVSLTCNPPSGSSFALGVTLVNCLAVDGYGNRDSCSFQVTVDDTEKPAITCPADTVLYRSPGRCDSLVLGSSATAIDNCPGAVLACTPPADSSFPLGTTTVTCIATDASGNRDSCSFTVTVYKGDMDGNGSLGPTDVVLMLNCVFLGSGNCDPCFADLDCDGGLTPTDVVIILNIIFLGTVVSCSP